MKKYTVIGLYEESGEVFADHVECYEGESPARVVSLLRCGESDVDPRMVAIVGVVEGHVQMLAPCEDSGCLAYACDLMDASKGDGAMSKLAFDRLVGETDAPTEVLW